MSRNPSDDERYRAERERTFGIGHRDGHSSPPAEDPDAHWSAADVSAGIAGPFSQEQLATTPTEADEAP